MPIKLDTNLQLSPADPRDYIAKLAPVAALPSSIDLKPLVVEVEDQGGFNSCTANAGCSALELMFNLSGHKVDLSRMYLYYYTRQLSQLPGDQGAYPRDIGAALLHHGTCYESTWDYNEENITTEPSDTAVAEAENFKILSYAQIADDVLPQIKTAVAQNIPVLLTMHVHNGMRKLKGPWQKHKWNYTTSIINPTQGLHEVLVIGYDDECERLLVENSWGADWGDGGFFGLPYSALVPDTVPELWILTPNPATITYLENNPPPPIVVNPIFKSNNNSDIISKIIIGAIILAVVAGVILNIT